MVKRFAFGISSAAVLAIAGSCGSTRGASEDSAPGVAWKEKTHDQRIAHMKSVVHPAMRDVFAKFDAEEFASFDCRTCHGSGADDGSFHMPNPDLPQLPGGAGGFERLFAEQEKVTTFMANIVVPAMAEALGEKPYGPDARDGFGCFRCHVTQR